MFKMGVLLVQQVEQTWSKQEIFFEIFNGGLVTPNKSNFKISRQNLR